MAASSGGMSDAPVDMDERAAATFGEVCTAIGPATTARASRRRRTANLFDTTGDTAESVVSPLDPDLYGIDPLAFLQT